MAPAYWFHVREGLAKRKWPLLTLMLNASVSPCILLVLFQAAMQVLELRESESERGESICAFFKRNCLGLQKFLPPTQSLLVFAVRSCGDLSSWHWNPQLGAWYWSDTPHSWQIPSEFLSTTCGCGTSLFHICISPTSLSVCGFFNSIVVRLPFNPISDGSEWWLCYILVVILMWFCEEASHVYLCRHLDQKSHT